MQCRGDFGGTPELHIDAISLAAIPAHPQGLVGAEAADGNAGLGHLLAEKLQAAKTLLSRQDRWRLAPGGITAKAGTRRRIGHQILGDLLKVAGVHRHRGGERRAGQAPIQQGQMVVAGQALRLQLLALLPELPVGAGGSLARAGQGGA